MSRHPDILQASLRLRPDMRTLELKIPPLALVLIAGTAMWFAARAFPALAWPFPFRDLIAALLALAGMAVAILGVLSFRRAGTTVNPTRPQSTSSLVSTGIYRYSRNPMYLGFLLALLGWATHLASLPALVIVTAFVAYMDRFQIGPEERALCAMFGDEFIAYTRKVRRWI
jgi:protein-S-isoprenylcysteine O-methyltransferase Ste14